MNKSKKKNLILVVVKTVPSRSHLRKVLLPEYDIKEASHEYEGLKMARKLSPELVIRDITVPVEDDCRWCRWCQAFKDDNQTGLIPLLLVFRPGLEDCIAKGFECGADECVVRPCPVSILKARIKSLVDNRRQLLEKIWLRFVLQPPQLNGNPDVSEFLAQLYGVIEDNLSDPLFSVEKLCDKLNMSRASMYRRIRSLTGESPQLFIRSYRLERAAQLLEANYGNVTEVCFSVGFTSTAYFTKCFKEKFHYCPKYFATLNGSNGSGSVKFSMSPYRTGQRGTGARNLWKIF